MRVLSLVAPPLCVSCRALVREGLVMCPGCRHRLEHLPRRAVGMRGLEVWAPLAYEGPARAVVRRLKFNAAVALADHMAAVIVAGAPSGLLGVPLVPVPSHPGRRRLRGFCHAELLAQALARRSGLAVARLLARAGDTRRQVGRARAERLRTPPRFRVLEPGSAEVLLVDDVVTTGATLGACARALTGAGWRCTRAVAYARTPVR